ncbi:nuclear protein MDM1-like isoform X3 [Pomacea canaliculata]|uniref:nuclear protein MDM1-like isoform X3 n=2 Tax=Pomacea canaliculata TaxID=400727 RepID=UPI000D72F0DB|nr:nuclear protein MDM1-like isoform X3 [Pomacea canaliculata]
MPVQFKNESESMVPTKSSTGKWYQPAQWAGNHSSELGISCEPALQHKKRVEGPPTSLSANLHETSGVKRREYALLGQQEKFAQNVQYLLKGPSSSDLSINLKENQNTNKRVDDKDVSPSKQMKIDAEKGFSKLKATPAATENKMETPASPPPTDHKPSNISDALKSNMPNKNLSDILQKETAGKNKAQVERNKQEHETRDESVLLKNKATYGQENQANHALKYKAGIAPQRKSKIKLSEYQKEFNWKQGKPASPLLTAEQMLYSEKLKPVPFKVSAATQSEYQRQFKDWCLLGPISPEPKVFQDAPEFQRKVKRSKSVGDNLQTAGSSLATSPKDLSQLRETEDNVKKSKPPIDYGKLRQIITEYRANYKAPTSYSYDQGAWKGAHPPHFFQQKTQVNQVAEQKAEEEGKVPVSTWFAEVLELRQRAQEYKRRAQGTHFSREHLAQLLAQQTGSRKTLNNDSVVSLDALALEPGPAALKLLPNNVIKSKSKLPLEEEGRNKQTQKAVDGKVSKAAWEENVAKDVENMETAADMVPDGMLGEEDQQKKHKTGPQNDLQLRMNEVTRKAEDDIEVEGRIPTPVLRNLTTGEVLPRASRHHLDLTTPCIGGVLLSSSDNQVFTPKSNDSCPSKSKEHFYSKQFTAEKTSPLYGKPTLDTHALRDDDSLSDRALELQYVSNPSSADISPLKVKRSNFQKSLHIPKTIDEKMGETYKVPQPDFKMGDKDKTNNEDDDILSVSAMSIASSSSLACEVYERAKKRRDHFWSHQKHGRATN